MFCGDMNFDIGHGSKVPTYEIEQYLNILAENGFMSLVNTPTRITERSKTCIDHCFVSNIDLNLITCLVNDIDVKDHCALMIETRKSSKNSDRTENHRVTCKKIDYN
jgi:energy-converting hydrogenase A subunit M